MPVEYSSGMCFLLAFDSYARAYEVAQDNTAFRRDMQIKIDAVMDTICMVYPLFIIYFINEMPVPINDMILVILLPSLCLFSKLRSIFREILNLRSHDVVEVKRNKVAKSMKRRRNSLFQTNETMRIAKRQQDMVPRRIRKGFAAYNAMYGTFMLIIGAFHLVTLPASVCNRDSYAIWKTSCDVKTPFCKRLFEPKCDCAVLRIEQHNWTTLPEGILAMESLKVMQINRGPLQTIDQGINRYFQNLISLDLSYNNMSYIPDTVGQLGLHTLRLANNKLNGLPDSIWGQQDLFALDLDNNNISRISSYIQGAESLSDFFVSNNSLAELPVELFTLKIAGLTLDGNQLISIPDQIGGMVSLQHLRLQNNNITMVTNTLGQLLKLRAIDLRNNRIHRIHDSAVADLKALKYIYLHNNPVCSNGWLDKATVAKKIIDESSNRGAGCK
eukprot:g6282.t1